MSSEAEAAGERRSAAVWVLALVLLTFLLGCFDMANGDIWWHLRTGQLIWQRGEIPRTDWYTYTNPDAAWIDLHWGFQLAAAGLYAAGGAAALVLAKSLIGAATIRVCLTVTRPSWPVWQTVACWLAPVLIYAGRYYVRPEVVSCFLLACVLAVLFHAERRPRLLAALPLIQLAWVNVQGLFVLQLVVLACWLAELTVRRWTAWPALGGAPPERLGRAAWLAAAGSLAACLVNPYGVRGLLFPLTLWTRIHGSGRAFYSQFSSELEGFGQYVAEHGAAGVLLQPTALLLVVLTLLAAATFVLQALRGRCSLYRLLLLAGFLLLAWQARRNSVLLALVGGVVVRANLGELVESLQDEARSPAERRRLAQWRGRRRLPAVLTALCLSLLIISVPTGWYDRLRPAGSSRKLHLGEAAWLAHDAAVWLGQPGFPRYLYAAHEGMAALCIFHLAPERRVFADARLEVHTRETLQRYLDIRRQLAAANPAAWTNLTRDIPPDPAGRRPPPALVFDNRTLVAESTRPPGLLNGILRSGRWTCVYSDPRADGATVFFAREQAAALGLPPANLAPLEWVIEQLRTGASAQRTGTDPRGIRPLRPTGGRLSARRAGRRPDGLAVR